MLIKKYKILLCLKVMKVVANVSQTTLKNLSETDYGKEKVGRRLGSTGC